MVCTDDKHILFIEPQEFPSAEPVIGVTVRRMAAILAKATGTGPVYMGVHHCKCGAESDNQDFELPDGSITNSLAVHYLAYHRHEIPREELAKVVIMFVACGSISEQEPTLEQLAKPKRFN